MTKRIIYLPIPRTAAHFNHNILWPTRFDGCSYMRHHHHNILFPKHRGRTPYKEYLQIR